MVLVTMEEATRAWGKEESIPQDGGEDLVECSHYIAFRPPGAEKLLSGVPRPAAPRLF